MHTIANVAKKICVTVSLEVNLEKKSEFVHGGPGQVYGVCNCKHVYTSSAYGRLAPP